MITKSPAIKRLCKITIKRLYKINRLENRQISGPARYTSASAKGENNREAPSREKSACGHTIVYALPPPDTPYMTSQSQC